MGERIFAGYKRGAVRATNRNPGNGMGEIYALAGELVDVGSDHIVITGAARGIGATLARDLLREGASDQ